MSDDLMALADAVFQSPASGPVSGSFALPDTRVPLRFGTAPTPKPTGPINPPPHPPPPLAMWSR